MNIADDLVNAYNDGYQQGKKDAVVRGGWIDYQSKDPSMCRTDGKSVFIQCSECFDMRVRNFATALNYCPNCGAKMESEV